MACHEQNFRCPFDAFALDGLDALLLRAYDALMLMIFHRATRKDLVACHEQVKRLHPQVGKPFCASNGAEPSTSSDQGDGIEPPTVRQAHGMHEDFQSGYVDGCNILKML